MCSSHIASKQQRPELSVDLFDPKVLGLPPLPAPCPPKCACEFLASAGYGEKRHLFFMSGSLNNWFDHFGRQFDNHY